MCWKSQSPSTLDPASGPEHPPSRATSASPCAARPHRPRGPWARRPPGTYKQPQLTEEKKKRQKNKTPGISPSNPRPGQSTLCDNTPRHRSRLRSRLRSRAVKSPLQSRLPVPPTPPPLLPERRSVSARLLETDSTQWLRTCAAEIARACSPQSLAHRLDL